MNKVNLSKVQEFRIALDQYYNNIFYNKFGLLISSLIICMQLITIYQLLIDFNDAGATSTVTIKILITTILAYISTDFINGIIHMYMDNNTNYTSIFGPFIAAFHMHHKNPQYKIRHPIIVYIVESGTKLWLALYLVILIYLQYTMHLQLYINLFLVSIGIMSSFAEVSHYWSHVENNSSIIQKLQNSRVLLSQDHHRLHHTKDNINYAFLNGISDPIINLIAKYLYKGYKNNADLHVLGYLNK